MIGPDPAVNPKTSLAITFCVAVQLSAGRPGSEATPAKHGVMRVLPQAARVWCRSADNNPVLIVAALSWESPGASQSCASLDADGVTTSRSI